MVLAFWRNSKLLMLTFGIQPIEGDLYWIYSAVKGANRKNAKISYLDGVSSWNEKECVDKMIESTKFQLEAAFYNVFKKEKKPFLYDDTGNRLNIKKELTIFGGKDSWMLQDDKNKPPVLNWKVDKYTEPETAHKSMMLRTQMDLLNPIFDLKVDNWPSPLHIFYHLKCLRGELEQAAPTYEDALKLLREEKLKPKAGKKVKFLNW